MRLTSWRWCMRRSDKHTGSLSPRGDVFSFFHSHLSSHQASSLDRSQSALTPIFSTAAGVRAQNRGLDRSLDRERSMTQMEYACQPRNDNRNTWYVPWRVLLVSLNVRWAAVLAAFACVTIDPASRRPWLTCQISISGVVDSDKGRLTVSLLSSTSESHCEGNRRASHKC